jgi:adenylate cyclase class 2
MSASGQETEAKFYVRDLNRVKSRLEALGASLIQERILEQNIRFDLPGAPLRAQGRVLRLRRDTDARLTYKCASQRTDGVLSREDVEFTVESFEKAKRFLEALGYQTLVYYEKYRATYELAPSQGFIHVMLDELPYGDFVEIEGETVEAIRAVASQLELQWEHAIATSYNALFDRVRRNLSLSMQDLSFAEFRSRKIEPSDLEVLAADR